MTPNPLRGACGRRRSGSDPPAGGGDLLKPDLLRRGRHHRRGLPSGTLNTATSPRCLARQWRRCTSAASPRSSSRQYPDWSPMMWVKSAPMTTATTTDNRAAHSASRLQRHAPRHRRRSPRSPARGPRTRGSPMPARPRLVPRYGCADRSTPADHQPCVLPACLAGFDPVNSTPPSIAAGALAGTRTITPDTDQPVRGPGLLLHSPGFCPHRSTVRSPPRKFTSPHWRPAPSLTPHPDHRAPGTTGLGSLTWTDKRGRHVRPQPDRHIALSWRRSRARYR